MDVARKVSCDELFTNRFLAKIEPPARASRSAARPLAAAHALLSTTALAELG